MAEIPRVSLWRMLRVLIQAIVLRREVAFFVAHIELEQPKDWRAYWRAVYGEVVSE